MATAFDAKNPALFDVPVPPQEFGQDGGKFYHYYDALADEIDDNMVAGLKEQLDGLLIFAGLFAGVNTAFLALTLPLMSPDPADDTNALLRDILVNLASGRNDTLPSLSSVPSETFSPTGRVLAVNVLFSVSLTFALVASFLAVLGRQWLVYYRKRTGGGPERQRWEQLKRFLGAERWRLEGVLDDVLPSLLQIGLIIFCISLTIYLNTLHPMLSNVVGAFMCTGLAFLIITAIFATWDKFCPFQSPLSHFLPPVFRTANSLIIYPIFAILCALLSLVALGIIVYTGLVYGPRAAYREWQDMDIVTGVQDMLHDDSAIPFMDFLEYAKRKEEGDGALQITAIRRAICTSDDARTQAHAVSNILSITDADLLTRLATDEEFDVRISELCKSSYPRTLQLCGRDRTNLAAATSWLYRAAITHIFLTTLNPDRALTDEQRRHIYYFDLDDPSLLLPSELMQNANRNASIACLGFMALFAKPSQIRTRTHRQELRSTIDRLVTPSWKCICMITEVMMVQWGINDDWYREVHAARIGEPSTMRQSLTLLLEKSNDPKCQDRDILRENVVDIFKLAWKAAADSGGDSRSRPAMAAEFLRFSEELVRGKDSPSNLINAGRNLRPEFISALQSECEKLSEKRREYTLKETLDELIQLFIELTGLAPDHITDERRTRTSSWDDKELVHLFSPILQQLNAIIIKNARAGPVRANTQPGYIDFRRQIKELTSIFANFEAVVKSSAARDREIKRRSREPDLRWCYYYE